MSFVGDCNFEDDNGDECAEDPIGVCARCGALACPEHGVIGDGGQFLCDDCKKMSGSMPRR